MTKKLSDDTSSSIPFWLQQPIQLQDRKGNKIVLPKVNVARAGLMLIDLLKNDFYAETGKTDVQEFWNYLAEKLDLKKGNAVLM